MIYKCPLCESTVEERPYYHKMDCPDEDCLVDVFHVDIDNSSNRIRQLESKEELTEKEWEEYTELIRNKYNFYIQNPRDSKGVNYSLYVNEDGGEYPVISSNSSAVPTFSSREKEIGDGIRPTEDFLMVVGYGFHEAMCFTPITYFEYGNFEETVDTFTDGKEREYEMWCANILIKYFIFGEDLIPELEPLARYASKFSEFGMPILG